MKHGETELDFTLKSAVPREWLRSICSVWGIFLSCSASILAERLWSGSKCPWFPMNIHELQWMAFVQHLTPTCAVYSWIHCIHSFAGEVSYAWWSCAFLHPEAGRSVSMSVQASVSLKWLHGGRRTKQGHVQMSRQWLAIKISSVHFWRVCSIIFGRKDVSSRTHRTAFTVDCVDSAIS